MTFNATSTASKLGKNLSECRGCGSAPGLRVPSQNIIPLQRFVK